MWGIAGERSRVYVAKRVDDPEEQENTEYLAIAMRAEPQAHGVIRRRPRSLGELDGFLGRAGVRLLDAIAGKSVGWHDRGWSDRRLMVLAALPKTRQGGVSVEATDLWCFFTTESVRELGIALGVWEDHGGTLAYRMGGFDARRAADVEIGTAKPVFDLTRAAAPDASAVRPDERKVVAVGVGSLGSQVVTTLARSGFGRWTMVDDDRLLPHNVARHAIDRVGVGHPKALAVAALTDRLYPSDERTGWVEANVTAPGDASEKLAAAFKEADLILDMAASVPVSRRIGLDLESRGRRMTLFLNPRGSDLVLLAESADRSVLLDELEMQYLRLVATDTAMTGHLAPPDGRLRYARSCRDVSSQIPNHLVTLHSSIAAQAVRVASNAPDAAVRVWRADPETLEVRRVEAPASGVVRETLAGWRVVILRDLLRTLSCLRAADLPNETGGVLVGAYDLLRRVVYVIHTIPSPPDSEKWPTLYIRGSEGLEAAVEEVRRRTDGQLEYVGEWHTHPDHCGCEPSDDDRNVFSWLTSHMGDDGLPALMAIVGRHGGSNWFIGEMGRDGGWSVDA